MTRPTGVLSPFNRSGELSVRSLNQILRTMVNPPEQASGRLIHGQAVFYDGDRVMMTENDWGRHICNGDIGRFCVPGSFPDEPRYRVVCGNHAALWENWEGMHQLVLAYAITVHKSQGSQYDTVILPITRQFSSLLYQNLIYTAISRAKKKIILVGDPDALDTAMRRNAPERKSMLVQKTRMQLYRAA